MKTLRSSHIWRQTPTRSGPKFLKYPTSRNIFAGTGNAGDCLVVDVDGEKHSRLKKVRIPQGVVSN